MSQPAKSHIACRRRPNVRPSATAFAARRPPSGTAASVVGRMPPRCGSSLLPRSHRFRSLVMSRNKRKSRASILRFQTRQRDRRGKFAEKSRPTGPFPRNPTRRKSRCALVSATAKRGDQGRGACGGGRRQRRWTVDRKRNGWCERWPAALAAVCGPRSVRGPWSVAGIGQGRRLPKTSENFRSRAIVSTSLSVPHARIVGENEPNRSHRNRTQNRTGRARTRFFAAGGAAPVTEQKPTRRPGKEQGHGSIAMPLPG